MPLFNLLNHPFAGEQIAEDWIFSHMQDHLEIIQGIEKQRNVTLIPWMIWPLNKREFNEWLLKHQQLHDDMNSELELQGVDLETVDFKDKQAMEVWIDINYREHLAARSVLAI